MYVSFKLGYNKAIRINFLSVCDGRKGLATNCALFMALLPSQVRVIHIMHARVEGISTIRARELRKFDEAAQQ